MKRISEKKLKKVENKKRKIEAFLQLIGDKPEEEFTNGTNGINGINGTNGKALDVESDDNPENSPVTVTVTAPVNATEAEILRLKRRLRKREQATRPAFIISGRGIKARVHPDDEVPKKEGNPSKAHENGLNGADKHDDEEEDEKHLSLFEMQVMVLACLMPAPRLSFHPTWCQVLRSNKALQACIFIVDDKATFKPTEDELGMFQEVVRFKKPTNWVEKLMNVPLSVNQQNRLSAECKQMKMPQTEKKAPEKEEQPKKTLEKKEQPNKSQEKKCTRKQLLLSPLQMFVECYPLPGPSFEGFEPTRDSYDPVTDDSPLFSIDCEMCLTTADLMEVTRISMVNEREEVLIDTLVKPKNQIKDYLTRYSGVTKEMLDPVTTTLKQIKRKIRKLLPGDAILCGQSLNADLKALGLIHPYVIDTSVIYNLSGYRAVKTGLKSLAYKFLQQKIQIQGEAGHCSLEDSIAALNLVKLKLSRSLSFGDRVLDTSGGSFGFVSKSLTMARYMELKDIKLNVFYNYVDLESNERFISIFNGPEASLKQTITKALSRAKAICIVLTAEGLCYIHF